jgi:hypothetical protein
MITNFKRLSETLDKAAPRVGKGLVAAIRAQKDRICSDINRTGAAYVEVDGQTFKVLSASGNEADSK